VKIEYRSDLKITNKESQSGWHLTPVALHWEQTPRRVAQSIESRAVGACTYCRGE